MWLSSKIEKSITKNLGGKLMKTNVAWSTDENAFLAGKACAKKAVLDLIQTKVALACISFSLN